MPCAVETANRPDDALAAHEAPNKTNEQVPNSSQMSRARSDGGRLNLFTGRVFSTVEFSPGVSIATTRTSVTVIYKI